MTFALIALSAYALLCAALFFGQRSLQYFPGKGLADPTSLGLADFEVVKHRASDGTGLVSWYRVPEDGKPVILYLQGNAQTIEARWERFQLFAEAGYGVFALGYRGYGASTGSPTEAGLEMDADSALAVLKLRGVPVSKVVVYGESIGTGTAMKLAARQGRNAPAAVILESPFTSAADVARTRYWFVPVGLLMKDQYNSLALAPKVKIPALVFHGTADGVIPFAHGKKIYEALGGPKEFITVDGGTHVAPLTPDLWARMDGFMRGVGF